MYKTRMNLTKILWCLDRINCNYNQSKYPSVNFRRVSRLCNTTLSELPETQVENLCSILRKEWPQSIQAVYYLKTCAEWKKKKPSLDISMYYNEKHIQSGLFMIIVKSGAIIPVLTTYALDSYEIELEDVFSNFLDKCDGKFTLNSIAERHFPILEKVIKKKGYKILWSCDYIVLSGDLLLEEATNLEIEYPSDIEVAPLKKENLEEIYERWDYRDMHNMEELENSLQLNSEFAWGIFCKTTGRLLCNCILAHNGEMGVVHTIEESRRKGYATLLLKHVAKKLAEHSLVPFGTVSISNEPSIKVDLGAGGRSVGYSKTFTIGKCK